MTLVALVVVQQILVVVVVAVTLVLGKPLTAVLEALELLSYVMQTHILILPQLMPD
jgi:hypothetical protein